MKDILYQLDRYVLKTAKKATNRPVYVRAATLKDKKEVARLVRYRNPTEYEVVFSRRSLAKARSMKRLKKIASHELAHIKHPGRHDAAFRKEAKKLGAGQYSVGWGTERRKKR